MPGRSRGGRLPAGFIGALALILLLDRVVARLPVRSGNGSRLEASWQSANRSAMGPDAEADVLCFGDSLIKLGIVPSVLEARVGLSAYNLAVLGGQPPTADFLLRRVLETGHRPRALIVNFSPLLLGIDPRVNVDWWAALPGQGERLELACRANDTALAVSLLVSGVITAMSRRDAFRAAMGIASDADDAPTEIEREALARNWRLNRGAQLAPRSYVAIEGSLAGPYDGHGWTWQPHPVHAYFVERFLSRAQARQIPVYWVLPPAEAIWFDRNQRAGTVDAYRRYVRSQLARFPVLTVLDVQHDGWDRAWFRDPIHLNRDGAVRLSMAVADAIAREQQASRDRGRWIELHPDAPAPARPFQDLLEDLDQSRMAVSRRGHQAITLEGPRR